MQGQVPKKRARMEGSPLSRGVCHNNPRRGHDRSSARPGPRLPHHSDETRGQMTLQKQYTASYGVHLEDILLSLEGFKWCN